jgi:hypothetical protein
MDRANALPPNSQDLRPRIPGTKRVELPPNHPEITLFQLRAMGIIPYVSDHLLAQMRLGLSGIDIRSLRPAAAEDWFAKLASFMWIHP